MKTWSHPGGKLREIGAESLSDVELLAVIISSGGKNKTAEQIGRAVVERFSSLRGMAQELLERFPDFKGVGDVEIIRIAAAFEIARRIAERAPDKR